jgi:hypothetical protein
VLKTQLICEDEIDALQKQVTKYTDELKTLAKENQDI